MNQALNNMQQSFCQMQAPLLCSIQNNKIVQIDGYNRVIRELGVTTEQYEEALKVAMGYKEKLEEAGLIKKPKTPQELHDEQMAIMQSLMKEVNDLKQQVHKYEHREDIVPATEDMVRGTENK